MRTTGTETQRGVTLVEALVVLVIVVAAISFGYRAMDARNKAIVAESYILAEARELKELAAAARLYANQNKASWTANTTYFAYLSNLSATTPPLLPTTWAQRGGTSGLTPIGETYRAIFRKDTSGVVRIVITDYGNGAPTSDVRIRQIGYLKTASSLDGYKLRVADQYAKITEGGYSAVVAANTMTARAPGGGFTQDLTAYFNSTAPTFPVAVVLVGWPEYPDGGDEGDGYSGTCVVAMGSCSGGSCTSTSSYIPPTCPGGYVERDRWTMCGGSLIFRNTPVGASLTITPDSEVRPGGYCDSYCDNQNGGPPCEGQTSTKSTEVVYLNASAVATANTNSQHCGRSLDANEDIGLAGKQCGNYTNTFPGVQNRATASGQTAQAILCCTD